MSFLGDVSDKVLDKAAAAIRLYPPDVLHIVRSVVDCARSVGSSTVDPEHLILAMLRARDTVAGDLLQSLGVTEQVVEQALEDRDAESLAELGVSLEDVRASVHRSFGESAWTAPLETCADFMTCNEEVGEALRLADRCARELRHWTRRPEHLLLALLRQRGRAWRFLDGLDIDVVELERRVLAELGKT